MGSGWGGESPRLQGSRSIQEGFSPSNSVQQLVLGFRNLAPPDLAQSPGWVLKKSSYGDSLPYREIPITQGPESKPLVLLFKTPGQGPSTA